jgi:hypothetical protein
VLVKGGQQRIWACDYDTDAETLTFDVNVAPAA